MLRSRVIPSLLLSQGGLVKTVGFRDPKYVGDPQNAIRIFNEKQVDELCVWDINAGIEGRQPDYDLIGKIADQCRMPLTYGGGISSADQADRIIRLGVEKVSIGSRAACEPDLLTRIADRIGSQSVVAVLDVKRRRLGRRSYEVVVERGRRWTGLDPAELARTAADRGAGEIVVNSIDQDGRMEGYDLDLVDRVRSATDLPMTVVGGAGSVDDLKELIDRFGPIGAAAGSLFVFRGPYKAVLISYQRPGSMSSDRRAG